METDCVSLNNEIIIMGHVNNIFLYQLMGGAHKYYYEIIQDNIQNHLKLSLTYYILFNKGTIK